jgi:hypothetical protein
MIPFTNSELKSLSNMLGHLPLALQIAAATLSKKNMSVSDFIRKMNETYALIVNSKEKLGDYEKTIYLTMQTSIDSVKCYESHGTLRCDIINLHTEPWLVYL